MKPASTAAIGGDASAIWMPKHTKITSSNAITNASSARKPRFISNNTNTTSSAVMMAPSVSGMPNSNFSAIAVPITSARSQAMMASSHSPHSARLMPRG